MVEGDGDHARRRQRCGETCGDLKLLCAAWGTGELGHIFDKSCEASWAVVMYSATAVELSLLAPVLLPSPKESNQASGMGWEGRGSAVRGLCSQVRPGSCPCHQWSWGVELPQHPGRGAVQQR